MRHKEIIEIDLNDGASENTKGILLIAENFIADIEIGVNKLIKRFKSKKPEFSDLKRNLRQSFKDCPPIGWYSFKEK